MMPSLYPTTRTRLCGAVLLVALAGFSSGCEDKAIGRPCDLQADAGTAQPTVNGQALECPTRICMRPAEEMATQVDTVPYCTAECSSDSDCEDGQKRGGDNAKDRRCKSGWVCGVPVVTGGFCCKKLCICRDFINIPMGGLQTPTSCQKGNTVSTCPHI